MSLRPTKIVSKFDRAQRTYVTALVTRDHRVIGEPLTSRTEGGRDRDVRNLRVLLPPRTVDLLRIGNAFTGKWQATVKECDGSTVAIHENTSRGALARDVYYYNASLPQES